MPEPQAVPLIRRSKLGEILSASRPASRDPLGGHLNEPPEAARGQVAVHVITEPRARIEPVGVKDDVLYLHTDQDAPRGKVVSADLAGMETGGTGNWAELIPERDDVLQRVERGGHGFLAVYLRDAQHRVVRFDAAGAELGELDLAGAGQHSDGSVSEVNVGEDSEESFLGVQSFVRGTRAYRDDLSTGRADPLVLTDRTAPVPDVVTERRSAISADGTTVPYFLLRPAGAGLGLPTLLYGYGGAYWAITPAFRAAWPAWLAAGGALAVANLRGGGEYGRQWHEAGTRERKQNVFDDFIAVGEHLISTGVTTRGQLALHGATGGRRWRRPARRSGDDAAAGSGGGGAADGRRHGHAALPQVHHRCRLDPGAGDRKSTV